MIYPGKSNRLSCPDLFRASTTSSVSAPKGVDGLNAGGWGVGLAISDNKVGVPLHEWNAMPEDIKQAHRDRIYPTTYQHGAHYVIDSIADLMPCLNVIEARLKRGEKP